MSPSEVARNAPTPPRIGPIRHEKSSSEPRDHSRRRQPTGSCGCPAPEDHVIPTSTGGSIPVRRVYCIGRNFAAHALEMGHDPDREPPFFFQKNPENLDASGAFFYPPHSDDVHHEVELLVALKSGDSDIPIENALDHFWGYGVSLEMTRRDLQGVIMAGTRSGLNAAGRGDVMEATIEGVGSPTVGVV